MAVTKDDMAFLRYYSTDDEWDVRRAERIRAELDEALPPATDNVPGDETAEVLDERSATGQGELLFDLFPDLEVPNVTTNVRMVMAAVEKIFAEVAETGRMEHLTPREVEELLAETLRRDGYESYLTPLTRDGGRDVIAVRPGTFPLLLLGEAKKTRIVSPAMIHRLETVRQRDRAHIGLLATTGRFSDATRIEVKRYWGRWIHLKDGEEFVAWIRSLRTRKS